MKKLILSLIFISLVNFSFASSNEIISFNLSKNIEFIKSYEQNLTYNYNVTFYSNDSCTASCYANVYYDGELVATFHDSSTSATCLDAQLTCLSKVKKKAYAYIAAAN
jgi:hypothetical protein